MNFHLHNTANDEIYKTSIEQFDVADDIATFVILLNIPYADRKFLKNSSNMNFY